MPSLLKQIVEVYIENYTLPTDPCQFNTINMSYIWQQNPELDQLLDLIDTIPNLDWNNITCYVLIQEPIKSFLLNSSNEYLISYDYWFGNQLDYINSGLVLNNTINYNYNISYYNFSGKCNVFNVTNGLYCSGNNSYVHNYSNDENRHCLYPFVESPVKQPWFVDVTGLDNHCGLPCNFDTDPSDQEQIVKFCLLIYFSCHWLGFILF